MLDFPKSVQKGYENVHKVNYYGTVNIECYSSEFLLPMMIKKYSILKFGMKGSWYSRMI